MDNPPALELDASPEELQGHLAETDGVSQTLRRGPDRERHALDAGEAGDAARVPRDVLVGNDHVGQR